MTYAENRNGAKHSTPLTLEEAQAAFKHLLNELNYYKSQFEVEKNIKNNLYGFIINEGMFSKLEDYHQKINMRSPDGHMRMVASMCLNLPEKTN